MLRRPQEDERQDEAGDEEPFPERTAAKPRQMAEETEPLLVQPARRRRDEKREGGELQGQGEEWDSVHMHSLPKSAAGR